MTDSIIDSNTSLSKQTHHPNQWRYDILRRGLYMLLFLAIYFVLEIAIKALYLSPDYANPAASVTTLWRTAKSLYVSALALPHF